jgi:uncharacterized membrane protein
MIEVRGAIPIGVSLGMNIWVAFFFACVSALIICPILIICLRPILNWLKTTRIFKRIATAVEDMFVDKVQKLEAEAEEEVACENVPADERKGEVTWKKLFGLFLFIAVPLPGTGVWTSSAIAAFIDLKYRYSIPTIIIGNFVSGLIITVMTILLGDRAYIIIMALFVLVLASIVMLIAALFFKKRRKTHA